MDEPISSSEKSKKINVISKQTIHQICSGQVIFDLATAVKELVENSLDSGATLIDIKLKDYGKTCISVSDNGSGVLEQDFEGLGLKHYTSKLREFSDLTEVSTFGFRGEALSSLCSLADLSIVTRHSTSEHGFKLQFDHNGALQKKEPCAREIGTTVHIKDIFKCLSVRAKEFQRNLKKEYIRAIQVLYSYCLVSTNTKITCSNCVSDKSPNLVINTVSPSNILSNINLIFGKKSSNGLIKIELLSPDEATLQEYNLSSNVVVDFEWDCYISSCDHDVGRSAPDRQFFYVNGRPCDLTKVSKLINQIYHKYNNKQYPFIFLNLKLNKHSTDINVTPNKRIIFCTQENLILATLKYNLSSRWDKLQGNLTVNPVPELSFGVKRTISPTNADRPIKRFHNLNTISKIEHTEKQNIQHINKNKTIQYDNDNDNDNVQNNITNKTKILDTVQMTISILAIKQQLQEKQNLLSKCVISSTRIKFKAQMDQNSNAENELKKQLTKDSFFEVIYILLNYWILCFNFLAHHVLFCILLSYKFNMIVIFLYSFYKKNILQMEIIGQFNLGFIITRLKEDLFIIDQHATDEKYRFEKLNNETQLRTQKLIIPKFLNISPLNETILIEHQKTFEDNGFFFKIDSEGESGHRVQLTGIPVSGHWQFGQDDIEELIFLIREGGIENQKNSTFRPSRVRQMLASKACRKAVMIGTALNNNDMHKLITQMAEMENPWNCPHGRPTIRHLLSLNLIYK